jgi:AcrR family transcriptional regulator
VPRPKTISDDEILDRALPLMTSNGPGGFTLAELGGELGMAPATLLQRFGSKKALIERVLERDNERFVEWLGDLPESAGAETVIKIYVDSTKLFGDSSSLADHLLWLREDIVDPVMNKLARKRFALFRAEIVRRLPPLPISGDRAAQLLDAQFHGAVVQYALEPRGRLVEFVRRSLKDWFRLCGH